MKTTTEPRHPVHHRRLNIRSLIQRQRRVLGHPGCYITLLVPGVTDIVTGLVAVVSHRSHFTKVVVSETLKDTCYVKAIQAAWSLYASRVARRRW